MLSDASQDTERPSSEEIYESATNTSNLKQEAERRTSADVLRDMAMSADRIGSMLIRLRGQWESTVKPERRQPRTVKQLAAILGDKGKAQVAHAAERMECELSYVSSIAAIANRLPELVAAREALIPQAIKWGWGRCIDPIERSERSEATELDEEAVASRQEAVEAAEDEAAKALAQADLNYLLGLVAARRAEWDAEDAERARRKIGQVIRYWLHQVCTKCDGTKWEVVPDTNRHGTKACRQCGGTGFASVPLGQDGRRLANHMDNLVSRYRQKMHARKVAFQSIPAIDRLSKRMQQKSDESD